MKQRDDSSFTIINKKGANCISLLSFSYVPTLNHINVDFRKVFIPTPITDLTARYLLRTQNMRARDNINEINQGLFTRQKQAYLYNVETLDIKRTNKELCSFHTF